LPVTNSFNIKNIYKRRKRRGLEMATTKEKKDDYEISRNKHMRVAWFIYIYIGISNTSTKVGKQ
jgi:hypothetical protein